MVSQPATPTGRVFDALVVPGRSLFALAIIGLGTDTLFFARSDGSSNGFAPLYRVIPVLPWLPTVSWLAYAFGAILVVLGASLLFRPTLRTAALTLGSLLFVCALILDTPKYVPHLGDMGLRTIVFEPLALATLAWLLPGRSTIPASLDRLSRYVLAVSLVVFGVDHFLALAPIGSLIPNWIPWHVFWIAFFGAVFVAAALSIALDVMLPWGATGLGLMFAIWVVTLHIPRVARSPHNPDEWSSLLIAVALWGGPWALAGMCASPAAESSPSRNLVVNARETT